MNASLTEAEVLRLTSTAHIYIVSRRVSYSFLDNGGSVHHFEIVGDFEESNPLRNSW
jgi:hypothetical protein